MFKRTEIMASVLGRPLGRMIIPCLLLSAGCSPQAWYEGFRESGRQKCDESLSRNTVQQCMDNVNRLSYPRYQREREELIKNSRE